MTREDLSQRIIELEERVCHLTQHHDEEIVAIHDGVDVENRCSRLFHINLAPAPKKKSRRRRRQTATARR